MKINRNLSKSSELAEIIGIMLGDGCLYLDKKNKYHTIIAFHKDETAYLEYVKLLFKNTFEYSFYVQELKCEFLLRNQSVFVGSQLIKNGLKSGNKIKNKLTIPSWIMEDRIFLINCIRGMFDTDGCIYHKYGSYAQIQFKFGSSLFVESVRDALIKLGFNPTKVQWETNYKGTLGWKIYLSRQNEIDWFFQEIQPNNPKHLRRYKKIRE